ncbi:MAG: hypothetical protein TE42_09435 [Candidatus Synechococcus spongiarum SP3]|uniref:Uncharacterized protein n=1 Tax=Candidatus Synechococcus spongiarum SP3 TaxID=1604020 RepID=A0A0G2IVK8_9SYNE|nr:MAG: hypothetical protein TE42_09435 [Candidatus Synechococcus spongiarum SP3]
MGCQPTNRPRNHRNWKGPCDGSAPSCDANTRADPGSNAACTNSNHSLDFSLPVFLDPAQLSGFSWRFRWHGNSHNRVM